VFLRRFLVDSSLYSLGSLITRGLRLILLPFTRTLTPHDYGLADGVVVGCGNDALVVTDCQVENDPPQTAARILKWGTRLG
jgi:hypothetical protein